MTICNILLDTSTFLQSNLNNNPPVWLHGPPCAQCVEWNTWGPIESGALYAFGWSEATVAMYANWGTIMFLASVVPLSKLVEVLFTEVSAIHAIPCIGLFGYSEANLRLPT